MIPQPHRTTLFPYTTLFRSQLNGSLKRWPNVKSRETHYTRVLREDWSGAMVSVGSDGRDRAKKSNRAAKAGRGDRKSTRLNSSHQIISYAVFCLKKKKKNTK